MEKAGKTSWLIGNDFRLAEGLGVGFIHIFSEGRVIYYLYFIISIEVMDPLQIENEQVTSKETWKEYMGKDADPKYQTIQNFEISAIPADSFNNNSN